MLADSAIPGLANLESISERSQSKKSGSVMLPPNPPIAMMGVPFDNVTTIQAITAIEAMVASRRPHYLVTANVDFCLLYTSDAADERSSVDLGGRRIIKKK